MPESIKKAIVRSQLIHDILADHYPPVTTFLTHKNEFELLIAVILSAQCTDERVNIVTPHLFDVLPTPQAFVNVPLDVIKDLIKSINFFNNKAKNIQATCHILVNQYNSQVPNTLNELIELPGVGRKTANVVLGQAFGIPGITVDTHVKRLSQRLKFTTHDDAVAAEKDLMRIWPEDTWIDYSSLLILHGRSVCNARSPQCNNCLLATHC